MNQMEQEAVRKCLENQDLVNKTKVSKLFKVMLSSMVNMSEVMLICLFSKNNFKVPTFFVKKIKNNQALHLIKSSPKNLSPCNCVYECLRVFKKNCDRHMLSFFIRLALFLLTLASVQGRLGSLRFDLFNTPLLLQFTVHLFNVWAYSIYFRHNGYSFP